MEEPFIALRLLKFVPTKHLVLSTLQCEMSIGLFRASPQRCTRKGLTAAWDTTDSALQPVLLAAAAVAVAVAAAGQVQANAGAANTLRHKG